ncbi:MAG TPA: rubrerythrin [Planctomycetaceae bacterium]|nr:rubrerythrin [Planctomycetaceae bacterium]HIQ20813.1 rubrerythrin [Planctomycetota bacterium]
MEPFESADAVLDFAIGREEEAARFYTELAEKIGGPISQVFRDFAREEQGHKAKLMAVKSGKKLAPAEKQIMDLKIGDYLLDVEPEGELDYQQALVIAMKREKAAFRLYMDLCQSVDDESLKDLFLGLAQEEAKHKLRFEIEYDEHILKEN